MNYDISTFGFTPYMVPHQIYSNGTLLTLNLGSYEVCATGLTNDTYDYLCQYAVDNNGVGDIGLLYISTSYSYLITNTNMDFVRICNENYNDDVEVTALSNIGHTDISLTSLNDYVLYLQFNTTGYYEGALLYDDFDVYIDKQEYCIYDFSNVYYPEDSNYLNWNTSHYYDTNQNEYNFYYSVIEIDRHNTISLNAGDPYQRMGGYAYESGYYTGYTKGYNNGFEDGKNTNITSETATAFDYIGGAFTTIEKVTSLEVLPHVTIGMCFAIPVVLVLIMTIFKIVRK